MTFLFAAIRRAMLLCRVQRYDIFTIPARRLAFVRACPDGRRKF